MSVPDPRRLWSPMLVLLGLSLAGPAPMAAAQSLGMELAEAPPEVQVTRWIVEMNTAMPEASIVAAAEDVLGTVETIEPLFPDEREAGLENLYILQVAEPVDQRAAYDLTYRLRALDAFDNAAPDFSYHAPYARHHAVSGCGSNLPDPPDKGWSLKQINAKAAWNTEPKPEGRRFGEGIKICHPDTGWADHTDLDREGLDLGSDKDIIDDDETALDPLDYKGSPGHGTATGSVLMSRGGVDADGRTQPPGEVTGVAPKAVVVPIRSIKSVVQFLDSDVGRPVNYARRQDCDVISMSLGGAGFFGLEKIVNRAVRNNDKIVVAAAGNCVGAVVAPALYPAVIAVAASNIHEKPWKDSSHGPAVAISAPGERVYVARRKSGYPDLDKVEASDGTSYPTTAVPAAAATWLAFH